MLVALLQEMAMKKMLLGILLNEISEKQLSHDFHPHLNIDCSNL